MTPEDATHFAATKHEKLPERAPQKAPEKPRQKQGSQLRLGPITTDTLLEYVGLGKERSAHGMDQNRTLIDTILTSPTVKQACQAADSSILDGFTPTTVSLETRLKLAQSMWTYNLSDSQGVASFDGFGLPDGTQLEPHPKTAAFPPVTGPMSGNATAQDATALMNQFQPQRGQMGAPAGSGLPQAGLPGGGRKAPLSRAWRVPRRPSQWTCSAA